MALPGTGAEALVAMPSPSRARNAPKAKPAMEDTLQDENDTSLLSPSSVSGVDQESHVPRLAVLPPGGMSLGRVLNLELVLADNADIRAGVAAAFEQMLVVLNVVKGRMEETETLVADLQAQADSLEEKRRLLARHADRADRDRDAAVQRCEEAERAARTARADAAPFIERYMECEVLRSQLQVSGDELVRLKEETVACREELERGWPRLAEAEDAEVECNAAVAQLEAAHTQEMAVLSSSHREEVAALCSEHEARMSELEDRRREDMATIKANNAEEIRSLRAALEAARWEADVFRREHADIIRETCLRQRENARLVKRTGEAKQEALELSVKLEALRAAEAGAPQRVAELQALKHRYSLLQRTAAEWGEALRKKNVDCEAWRRWAVHRGAPSRQEDLEEADGMSGYVLETTTSVGGSLAGSPQGSAKVHRASLDASEAAMNFTVLESSGLGSSLSLARRSLTPTPGRRPSGLRSQGSASTPGTRAARSRGSRTKAWPPQTAGNATETEAPRMVSSVDEESWFMDMDSPELCLPPRRKGYDSSPSTGLTTPMSRRAAEEFAVRGKACADSSISQTRESLAGPLATSLMGRLAAEELTMRGQACAVSPAVRPSRESDAGGLATVLAPQRPGEEFVAAVLKAAELEAAFSDVGKTAASLQEANNDIEMLAFLLDDAEIDRATRLLNEEIARREEDRGTSVVVVRRLQAQLGELQKHVKLHAEER